MKFSDYIIEGAAEDKKAVKLGSYADKMKQDIFKRVINNSPIEPDALLQIKQNGPSVWKVDRRHTGGLGGWGNQVKGYSVSFQAGSSGMRRQLVINRDGKMSFGISKSDWDYKVQYVPLDPKTYVSDIKTLGRFFKEWGGEDISSDLLSWISEYVVFPDPKVMQRLKADQDKLIAKMEAEIDKLNDFYRSNRSEIITQYKADPDGTAMYVIKQFKKSIQDYRLK